MEKWFQLIIITQKSMPQYPCGTLQHSNSHSHRRQNNSIKYKEKEGNTPLYSQSLAFNLSFNRLKAKKSDTDEHANSFQTCESENGPSTDRDLSLPRRNKIKVQLCKNFVEKGYCPYQNRCKFAHGIEQLRAKDTQGSSDLYRTRKCKIFYDRHECKFGQRCNFMHQNRKINQIVQTSSKQIREALRSNFYQIHLNQFNSRIGSSRLLELLNSEFSQ